MKEARTLERRDRAELVAHILEDATQAVNKRRAELLAEFSRGIRELYDVSVDDLRVAKAALRVEMAARKRKAEAEAESESETAPKKAKGGAKKVKGPELSPEKVVEVDE